MFNRLIVLAFSASLSIPCLATNNGGLFGDTNTTNNNQTYNQPTANGGQGGTGYGGSAISNATIGDTRNTNSATGGSVLGSGNSTNSNVNTALGGQGGTGIGIGVGGSAAQQQGQQQGQGQQQSNIGINGQSQSSSNVLGQSTDASSTNDNRSSASSAGNSTMVGGQQAANTTTVSTSYVAERNAPPVYLGNLTATMSCSGSFQAGGSQQGGSGAFGFTWISGDCRSVVAADKFRELGMVDTACRILKTTKGFKRAAKADASLKNVDCTAK